MASPRNRNQLKRIFAAVILTYLAFSGTAVFAQTPTTPSTAAKPLLTDPNLCWLEVECLDPTVGGNVVTQPDHARCDKQHCWEAGAGGCSSGQGRCYANPPPVPLVVHIGGAEQAIDLGDYIAKVYNYGSLIAITVAAVMFMVGGFQYLTGGDSERIKAAKKRITDSLIGLVLVMGAYALLNTINPDILTMRMPKIPIVKRTWFVGCTNFEMQVKCGDPFSVMPVPGVSNSAPIDKQFRLATDAELAAGQGIMCRGASCSKAGFADGQFRCQVDPSKQTTPPTTTPTACGVGPADPYVCLPCGGWGADCTHVGKSNDCCTGFCGARANTIQVKDVAVGTLNPLVGAVSVIGKGLCTNGENGINCDANGECRTGKCQTRGLNDCSSGLTGAACDDATQCANGYACPQILGMYICTPKVPGSYCYADSDCPAGYWCPKQGGGALSALAGAGASASAAMSDACKTSIANAQKTCDDAVTSAKAANDLCNLTHNALDCAKTLGLGAWVAAQCAGVQVQKLNCAVAGAVVNSQTAVVNTADDKLTHYDVMERCRPVGTANNCKTASDCPGMKCVSTDNDQSVCTTGVDGSPCKQSGDCNSGHCIAAITKAIGTAGICSNGDVGERCSKDSDCTPSAPNGSPHCYVGDKLTGVLEIVSKISGLTSDSYGFCVSGKAGSGCNPKGNNPCESGLICSENAHMCVDKPNACGTVAP